MGRRMREGLNQWSSVKRTELRDNTYGSKKRGDGMRRKSRMENVGISVLFCTAFGRIAPLLHQVVCDSKAEDAKRN